MGAQHEVFLVEHLHVLGDGEEDVKIIGIYSSREAAQRAVDRLRLQPGFRDTPEGFTIDLYWLDQDNWQDGYVTLASRLGAKAAATLPRPVAAAGKRPGRKRKKG